MIQPLILPLIFLFELANDLLMDWAEKAAAENEKEFETADANSMNAWKYFPF